MKNIFDKKKDEANFLLYQNFISQIDFEELRSSLTESIYIDVKNKIRKDLPEIFEDLQKIMLDLRNKINSFEDTRLFVIQKTANIIDSSSLCSDVYKMRDDMKEMSETIHRFKLSIKNIFISYEDEDED